ncbi:hypothetical protein [Halobacterium rubrum]|uniref:hypothetical protein n=1 Tax=Halobacterium TaxID=2239 RepID=UPI001F2BD383|nr:MULTISPECIES: hypothetical protein [Halobacterium]MDH5020681.1 hypothetical protein [Halobacterium rubrum]
MPTSQGTSSGTRTTTTTAGEAENRGGSAAMRQLLWLGGGLALLGAALSVGGIAASTPLLWAFGLGAVAVSLSVLAVTGYHGRAQSA